jgi:hypothetical protein
MAKSMKKSMKKRSGMKKAMKKSMKKGGMKRKAKRVSKVAKGRGAKARVFRGTKARTSGGLKKSDLMRNKSGKVVSRKRSEAGKKLGKKNGILKFAAAVKSARKALGIKGFQAVGGKSAKGQALLKKARSIYRK